MDQGGSFSRGDMSIMGNGQKKQRIASIFYEGTLEDGTVFDSNKGSDEPLPIILGAHEVIPGLEQALETMVPGEERDIVVPPELAYGFPRPEAIQRSKRSLIKGGEALEEGMSFKMRTPASSVPVEGKVMHVNGDFVEIDFNHPLAGETLYFSVVLDKLEEQEMS